MAFGVFASLSGNEVLQVTGIQANGMPSGQSGQCTTGQIAALAASGNSTTVITALNTVGAGTITAAGIIGKITQRGGSQGGTAFTDTTDTAANIIALLPAGAQAVGDAFSYTYQNLTNAVATIAGGVGVTVTGEVTIPANGYARYLLTIGASSTITMVQYENGGFAADATDSTKVVGFKPSGQTTGTAALIATVNTANATYTLPTATDTLVGIAATQTLTNKTLTTPTINNPVISGPAPVAVGASATAAAASGTYLLNATTGSVLTLPAATGTGNRYKIVVTGTIASNSHKVLAASTSDNMQGLVVTQKAGTASWWAALVGSTYHSLQMPAASSTPQGGTAGDSFDIIDAATNVWQVNGMTTSGGTVATPFSTADS